MKKGVLERKESLKGRESENHKMREGERVRASYSPVVIDDTTGN